MFIMSIVESERDKELISITTHSLTKMTKGVFTFFWILPNLKNGALLRDIINTDS